VSSDPVSRAAAQNAWLRKGLAAERRLGASNGQAADGPVLASDADNEHAVEALQVAYAEGRLAKDDFDARVGRALDARTTGDLTAATARLPGPSVRPALTARARTAREQPRGRGPLAPDARTLSPAVACAAG
jgi:hypothetical protein